MSIEFIAYLKENMEAFKAELGADAISIYEKDSDGEVARLIGWCGEKPREVAPFDLPPIGTCAKTGKGLLIERKHARAEKYSSIVIVPLGSAEHQLGVLNCASCEPLFFKNDERLTAVRSLAEHLAKVWTTPSTHQLH